MSDRPKEIIHYSEIKEEPGCYRSAGSKEPLSAGSPFGKKFGFQRLGIHHETLSPGRRTSWPHAEKTEEEFVYVIEGTPDVWIDGYLHRLKPGDGVGFTPGTGVAHTFINNTSTDVQLLTVGDTSRGDNQCFYVFHEKRNQELGAFFWKDRPKTEKGPHNGLPDNPDFKIENV